MDFAERVRQLVEGMAVRRPPLITTRRPEFQYLSAPPRGLSPALAVQTLFGGFLQQFGWLFFGFGMVFFWVFVMQSEIASAFQFRAVAVAEGRVTGHHATSASENETRIYATTYEYRVKDVDYGGTSYAPGQHRAAGERIAVEYARDNPARSRIQGMRTQPFSSFVVFVAIFPAVGLGFILFGLRGRFQELSLLRSGIAAYGRLVDKQPTHMQINNRPVYRLRFEFQARDGRNGVAEARSHTPEVLEDEAEEPLLYDPADLNRAVLLDALPGRIEVGMDGQLRSGSVLRALASLALPALALGGHGLYFYLAYWI
jgi:hypothetical protein